METDTYGNPIETAPDGRRYLAGFLRPYKVTTSEGQEIVFRGKSREEARQRAEAQLHAVHAQAVERGWTTPLASIATCEALRPGDFPA